MQRVVADDARVVQDRADRRHDRRQRVDVGLAAGLLEPPWLRRSSQTVSASTASGSAFSLRRIIERKMRWWRGR